MPHLTQSVYVYRHRLFYFNIEIHLIWVHRRLFLYRSASNLMYDLLIHSFEGILILYKFRKICTCLSISIHMSCIRTRKKKTFRLRFSSASRKTVKNSNVLSWDVNNNVVYEPFTLEVQRASTYNSYTWHARTHAHTHAGKKNDLNFFHSYQTR